MAMGVIAVMLRNKLSKNPYVAPTDLFGAIFVADLSVAADPSLLARLIPPTVDHEVVSLLHAFACVLGIVAWIYCISGLEPNLEEVPVRIPATAGGHQKSPFSFRWLAMYVTVMCMLAVHYYVYAYRMWPKI
jgi:hypothetical protein